MHIWNSFWKKSWTISLIAVIFYLNCNTHLPTSRTLEENFKNPPSENRALALWPWLNGYVDTSMLVFELEEMKRQGLRGALIWDVGSLIDPDSAIPHGPAFLESQSLDYISLASRTAKRLDLDLGIVASSSWNAGGPWVKKPDASMELLTTKVSVIGPGRQKISIPKPTTRNPGSEDYVLVTSMALRHSAAKHYSPDDKIIILDEFTTDASSIDWMVPEGNWDILSFFMGNTLQPLVCPSPNSNGLLIDHLSKEASKNHFDSILTRLKKIDLESSALKYLMLDSYEVWSATDWSPHLLDEFRKRYNYEPTVFLPLLAGYSWLDSITAERFRSDYQRLVSDMMVENHFAQSVEIADKYGMRMISEAGHGGHPRVEPLKALGNSHIPMGEFWNRQRHWVTKEAASAAHIYGKKIVASESLTGWQNWQHGPTDFKQLCDIAFCEGLNQIVFHTFAHNPQLAGKPGFAYHAGEHLNVNTTWWEMVKPFMDYLARCSFMLRQGNFIADALLYYGDDAPNLVPPKRIDPNYTPDMPGLFPHWFHDESKCPHCGRLKPVDPGQFPGYDYDNINSDIITTALQIENGKLTLPHGQSYRLMMIPDRKDMSVEVLKRLEQLIFEGATVIGPKPERATSLKNYPECDEQVKSIAEKIWGNCDGTTIKSNQYGKGTVHWGKSLKQVLDELQIPPDFDLKKIDNNDHRIDYIHRQTETEDIYFVSNSSEIEKHFTAVFRVDTNRIPEIWDAETGLVQREVSYSKTENGISLELVMDPLASRFVLFKIKSSGKNDAELKYDLQYGFPRTENNLISLDITSNWDIRFDTGMGGPEKYTMDQLMSWSDVELEGIKYYSGKATYTRTFSAPEKDLKKAEVFVLFDDIQEMARVFINDNDCGIVWTPPYRANITPWLKPGNNTLRIEVINTWNNRIVGDVKNPGQTQYTISNIKNSKFTTKSTLLKSGLAGKAEIVFINYRY